MNARSTSFEFTCLSKRINEVVSAIFHSVIFNRCFGKFQYKGTNSYYIGTMGFEEVICDFIDFTYIRVASLELAKHINTIINTFVEELGLLSTFNNQRACGSNPLSSSPSSGGGGGGFIRRPSSLLVNEPTTLLSTSPTTTATSPAAHYLLNDDHHHLHSPNDQYFQHHHHHQQQQQQLLLSPMLYTSATGSISLEFLLKSQNRWPLLAPEYYVWEVWTLKINCLKDEVNESLFNNIPIEDQIFDKLLSIVSIVNDSKSFLPQMPNKSELENVFDTSYSDVQPFNFKISYKIGKDSNESYSRTNIGNIGNMGEKGALALKFFKKKLNF